MNFGNITKGKQLIKVTEHILLETMPATKTPSKRNSRKSTMPQSLGKPMKRARTRRLSSYDTAKDFAVEVLTESTNVLTDSHLEMNKKHWQKCFVNIEYLTPNKLNLVKTITPPLVEIKNEIMNRGSTNNVKCNEPLSSMGKENIDVASCIIDNNGNESTDEINKVKEEVVNETVNGDNIVADTLNDTFTLLPNDEDETGSHDTTFTVEEQALLKESPALSFSSLKIPELDDIKQPDVNQLKRLSISQRLSKSMKPFKSQKISNMSKVTKSSRLASVASARVPKISNSKAIQLYEFLSNGQMDKRSESDTKEQSKPVIIVESPPSGSSTPNILKNHAMKSLLKSTSRKNNVSFADQPSTSSSSCANENSRIPKVTYRKMPNFAAIHQKAFGRMENISDYEKRKSERAKLLLSGTKPQKSSPAALSPTNKTIKKELLSHFSRMIPRDTPTKKHFYDPKSSQLKKEDDAKTVKIDKKSPFTTKWNQMTTNKIPGKTQPIKANNILTTSQIDSNKSTLKSASSKGKIGLTRFGFKVPLTNKKEEVVKAVMTKTRALPDNHTKNEQRAIIKGVRSNRRFDLLMKMRSTK